MSEQLATTRMVLEARLEHARHVRRVAGGRTTLGNLGRLCPRPARSWRSERKQHGEHEHEAMHDHQRHFGMRYIERQRLGRRETTSEQTMTRPSSPPIDPAVAARLVADHRAFLAFVERRVESRAIAEDILQEAFVRGLERGGQVRDEESAHAWFYRVLRNAIIDYHRRHGTASRGLDALASELEGQVSPPPDVHDVVCQCITGLTDALKPEYAEALRRIEVEGVAVKDYGAELGITASNAAVRVFRARKALREHVMRSCGTCAEHGCIDCTCRSV
jgi:RNA polymerase sigma factor (sigma-70 family)